MKFTESEWQIMNTLWEKSPASAREIIEKLPENIEWAYTTVKTMLSRLVSKKAVSESKNGNTSFYSPLVTRENARQNAFSRFLNQAFEGAVEPLLHFLVVDKNLTEKQRQELLQLLQEEEQKKENGNG